ncbi:YcxB-like protein [Siphonobacter aquaeclarae]|uniref:YcxB-like protein n=2 Tax=Siphonobacter aquaeclarae TaxID=563176 RepID=A0A1G9WEN6_9BACT|nr:YcxB-like protein [Siphonobacter aquaeclarae]
MAKAPVNRYQQPYINNGPVGMPQGIRTKKYGLEPKMYINLALREWIQKEWFWFLIPVGVIVVNVILNVTNVYPNWWIYLVGVLGAAAFGLFRAMQFTATTQVEQNKPMFEKFVYEFDNRQIFVWKNREKKEGGQLPWNMIQSVKKEKDAYLFILGKYQYVHIPFAIFNSEHDIKMFETLLSRKELLK